MAGEAAKVKLLCSFGGKIVPRPGDSALRYVGGHTRIVSLRRDLSFPELLQKMSEVLGGAGVVIKYQLPDEDLDSLVTVSCPDDLVNMMEELDNLSGALPDGSAKLRVFLFDPPSPLPLLLDTSDPTRRYIDALNSVPPEPSPHNSDTSTPPEPTPAPDVAPVLASPQPLYVPPQDPFSPAGYASYVSNAPQMQYFNAQQFGFFPLTPAAYHTGKPVQSLSQLPPLPSSSALQTANAGWNHVLVPAQGPRREDCGLCQKALPHAHSDSLVNDTTGGAQELNPVYHSLRLEDVANFQAKMVGGGLPDSVSEQRSEAAAVPGIGVAGPVGCYEYPQQIPRIVNDGERIAPRKVENVDHNSIVFSTDIGGFPVDLSSLYMPATTSGYSYPMVIADQLLLQQQPPPPPPPSHWPSMQHPAMQGLLMHKIAAAVSSSVNAENVHVLEPQQTPHSSVVQQVAVQDLLTNQAPAIPSAASMIRLPHGMQPSYREGGVENFHALPVEGIVEKHQPHLPAAQHSMMHDLLSSKLPAVDLTPGAVNMVHTLQPSFREGGDENSFTHVRPIEGMMEALSVNSEVHATREHHKSAPKSDASTPQAMDSESHFTVMESRDNPELVGTKELLGNAFVSTTPILPEAGSTNLMVHLPTSALDTTYANPSQYLLGSHMLFPQPPIAAGEPPIPHKRLLGAANANKVPSGDRKEQTSTAPVTNILPDVFSGNAGTLPPLPNIGKPSEINVSEVRNPLPLDPFFNTTDPWGIQQSVQAQPPKPVRVASGGSLASKDMVMENHPGPSEAHSIVVGKGSAQTPLNLISDPLSELIPPIKEVTNAQIKQGPPVVTENLATPVPAVSGTTGLSPETFNIQGAPSMAADPENKYIDDHGHEDGISKQHDRPNHGFQLSEDIERLQIIKDSDLEELSELGSGTFGTVYHGKWRGTDVAIKRISDRCFAGKPSDQERMRNDFWNEACNLADLHHPNVVAFYGVVLDGPGGSIATVTEFMVNGSLRKVLEKNDKALDMRKRLRIATDVACGMEYLHGKKIVHFDLKSDNLLVNLRDPHRPICKVGDLGLSKVKCQTLISGGVRGTLPWMAPELLSGDSNLVTDKVDVFSFGIVMWELLTGEEPYADLHYGAIIGGIVNNTLRPPVSETCDPEWRSLMEKCWSAEPSDRPTFTEVVAKLQSMAASYPRKGQPHPNPPASLTIQK